MLQYRRQSCRPARHRPTAAMRLWLAKAPFSLQPQGSPSRTSDATGVYSASGWFSHSIPDRAIAQDLRLESEPVAGPLRRGDDAFDDRHRIDPDVVGEAHIFDP